ncbi:putative cathepsin B6 cysteine protease [Monocercomonoides exilis]|uniref:putative cathepsin B6 cysteine protease n=1 Tax=Monocercomonoides exilis TaxID=2049356 RepID=UPI00355A23BF|nr:putative cathepsin B6 cysteine protease [Monocercomonoides exilis]|eukprot:MONOS_14872.1-p1 / transcript=MONOS_14872.1 / gene=MONOS_14872 / organism=Monocercomonoides_exilis_PA203 / gene_product=cathepsin B6 cysteine protease / transcript_product=cathepsin B6 cysteine protease / location=Mono_scaffold01091:15928-16773(-) / protein_length=281 / sequence_SO=supercontig / SO=protein_coding / is_pseudo=false
MIFYLFASVIAESIVETVNNDPSSTWVAIEYPREVITLAKMRAMLGEEALPIEDVEYVEPNNVPENFDAREQWPGKIYPVRSQASCGSCWAHTASEAIGNRFSIKGCGKGMLSVQDLVSCDKSDSGCKSGSGPIVTKWLASNGVTTEECLPYVSGNGRVPSCPTKCANGSRIVRYKYEKAETYTVKNVQEELMKNGPVYFRFTVYTDFMNYKSGIYQHKSGYQEGGHAVLLIGWGVEDGVPYWLLQNSWGTGWGEKGHFKFIRGKNDCGCEQGFYAGPVKC